MAKKTKLTARKVIDPLALTAEDNAFIAKLTARVTTEPSAVEPKLVATGISQQTPTSELLTPSSEQTVDYLIVLDSHPACSVSEFRDYTNTGTGAKYILLDLEARNLVERRWLQRAHRFSLTAAGKAALKS